MEEQQTPSLQTLLHFHYNLYICFVGLTSDPAWPSSPLYPGGPGLPASPWKTTTLMTNCLNTFTVHNKKGDFKKNKVLTASLFNNYTSHESLPEEKFLNLLNSSHRCVYVSR